MRLSEIQANRATHNPQAQRLSNHSHGLQLKAFDIIVHNLSTGHSISEQVAAMESTSPPMSTDALAKMVG